MTFNVQIDPNLPSELVVPSTTTTGTILVEVDFSDYRSVQGAQVPYQLNVSNGSTQILNIQISSVTINGNEQPRHPTRIALADSLRREANIMRILRMLGCFVLSFAFLLVSPPANAQVDQAFETGLNPYRSYQSGNIDTISLWNRQLNVDIPLISYPQRGGKLPLNFVLHYADLGNWYDENCSTNPCSYTSSGIFPNSGFGVIQAGTVSNAGGTCGTDGNNNQDEICDYSLVLADGSGSLLSPTNNTTWKSNDLRGFQLSNFNEGKNSPSALLSDRNGISYEANSSSPPGNLLPLFSYAIFTNPPGQVEDTNGNYITYQPYGSGLNPGIGWTDTMGRNIPLPISTSVTPCPKTPLVPDSAYLWNFPGLTAERMRLRFAMRR